MEILYVVVPAFKNSIKDIKQKLLKPYLLKLTSWLKTVLLLIN